MSTIYQCLKRKKIKKKTHSKTPALVIKTKHFTKNKILKKTPQSRGVVMKARIVTPRKPNSAKRPVAKVILRNHNRITAHIPGVGHNLKRHSSVLIKGGGARDLPGVNYSCIRGVYDCLAFKATVRRRSILGIKRPLELIKKRRRKFRQL
jgi:small subunit ribosomal protein S12